MYSPVLLRLTQHSATRGTIMRGPFYKDGYGVTGERADDFRTREPDYTTTTINGKTVTVLGAVTGRIS